MKTYKLACLIVIALFFVVIVPAVNSAEATADNDSKGLQLSVETLGAIRHADFSGKPVYGAGAAVGLQLNKYVGIKGRVIAYETDNWGGGVVDEASALVEAKLLSSANGKLSLSAIGGGHYDIGKGDFGFGVGARVTANIYGPLSLFGQSEVRAWFNQPKDIISTAGLQLSF